MTRDARPSGRNQPRSSTRPAVNRPVSGRPSAPRGTQTKPSTKPARRARVTNSRVSRTPRNPRSMRRLAVIGVLLVFLAVVITPTLRAYLAQRSQIGQLTQQVAAQQANITSLQNQQKQLNDPKYIAAQAGAQLAFAKPGQTLTIYVTTEPSAAAKAAAAAKKATWYGSLWQSVVNSGKH
ncbi:septum formation initiator family protein [Rudaeicoccus suwonensis]|uniref:Cell division protein FtsB n=1 Tax=Rudaeicoccus suwonensis TaxID=657409 RepID=A0A561E888_9MICO|nr:septum formation initiator family protein [Rudaeicoccus suwonensis]TWE11832.1 cell division protein FtsB [Rudaeicoccus suwonensis]